ncbi:MAG: type III-B CRISPR module RAMP protein Cmr6 [Clostridiales bacterium]|nr:type III-B CRISPR module RAMP protein Cmr6 [Clostridiales bacterium]
MEEKGIIKKYFADKGFGFIKYNGGDIFFHKNQTDEGEVAEGAKVSFTIGQGRKGLEARNVKILTSATNKRDKKPCKGYLPKDTADLIDYNKIDNFNLKLNKVAQPDEDKPDGDTFKLFKADRKKTEFWVEPNFKEVKFQAIAERQKKSILSLGLQILTIDYIPDWRLAIGLGNASVYETSMTLHHVWGIPYLPGSSLKGLTRNWAITEEFNGDENAALKDPDFCKVFGSPKSSYLGEHKGEVIFFDALPVSEPTIEADIMNPHYSKYYSDYDGTTPPADYFDPVPVTFLTVKEGNFKIYIGAASSSKKYLELAYDWLKRALREHGIGAKTAAGYGYNKVD